MAITAAELSEITSHPDGKGFPADINPDERLAFMQAQDGTLELVELMATAERMNGEGRRKEAIALYDLWLAHTRSPLAYVACFNLGVVFGGEKDFPRAEAMYRKALDQNPEFIRARLNLGNNMEQQGRDDEALEQWRIALQSPGIAQPENLALQLHALNNLGRLLEMKKQYQEALVMLEKSFALDPTQRDVLLHLVHLIQKICRWPVYAPPKGITRQEMIKGTSPLAMLAAFDDPELQLAAARQFVEYKYPGTEEPLAPPEGYEHEKVRIGYLSSDFCLHAVSLLTAELYELHDRNRFEVHGFCWSKEDGSALRARVIKGMDHFVRIGSMGDKEAAECIRSREIDILVDLQGLTSGARPKILSYRPAPVQVTYLGFPGTTGLPWIDYVVADRFLIPETAAPYYSEKPLYMPGCFQVSDSRREVGPVPKRADNGLPEHGMVFCSFNNNYKFTPELFAVWMRILKKVPNSVLWLLADNEWARENLCQAAKKQGIKTDRLIFASRVAPADYLARYQLADLFLDTYPFNGGTTANDALWMGLPLLTCSGKTFASRMAGSLLTSLGLPELITGSLDEYEKRAIKLARDPANLRKIKARLDANRKSGATFDIPKFVQGFDAAMLEVAKGTRTAAGKSGNAIPDQNTEVKEVHMTQKSVSQGDILNLINLIRPWNMSSDYKVRIGADADGGYVLPASSRQTNLVFSIGIGNEVSFDKEMAGYGARILQFDHTIEQAPLEHANIRFMRQGWGPRDSASENLISLKTMIAMADWENAAHPILKFDAEGAEWEAFESIDSGDLERFEILTGEFHDFQQLLNREHFDRVHGVFTKLASSHNVVHLHANNAGGLILIGGIPMPRLLELTYLRKSTAVFAGHSSEPIPGPLDRPNIPQAPDLYLRTF